MNAEAQSMGTTAPRSSGMVYLVGAGPVRVLHPARPHHRGGGGRAEATTELV